MLVQGCRVRDRRNSDRQGWTPGYYSSCWHYKSGYALLSHVIAWVGPYFNCLGSVSRGGPLYLQCRTNLHVLETQWLTGAFLTNQQLGACRTFRVKAKRDQWQKNQLSWLVSWTLGERWRWGSRGWRSETVRPVRAPITPANTR